ncbi:MAG: site-specific integrase [Bacteroidales bacterium]|nr:site-specific integrase [Bacteroidales bacterium]
MKIPIKMKVVIYNPRINAKRIKIYIPYKRFDFRKKVKSLNSSFWHPSQKLWSIINTKENLNYLKNIFGNECIIKEEIAPREIKSRKLSESGIEALNNLEKVLTLKGMSKSTINTYKNMLTVFFSRFMNSDVKQITKEQIESFIYQLIKENKISESYQNQIINAIKAYYEYVLEIPREYYEIRRPKRSVTIPNVLSEEEVMKIIQSPDNLKHRAILWTIYSAGLRISELTNLRIADINSKDGYIYVKDSKGKKDRKTILSEHLIILLRKYYKSYKPSYWLFEGQTGGKYSVSSIRYIFRRAVKNTNSNPWATVHTLRHSFATHCIQNGVNMRHIQNMLGHNNPKTTEIYTKTIEINNKKITSPLDNLLKNNKLDA